MVLPLPSRRPTSVLVTVPKTSGSGFQKYNKPEVPTPCPTPYPRSQPQSLRTPPDSPIYPADSSSYRSMLYSSLPAEGNGSADRVFRSFWECRRRSYTRSNSHGDDLEAGFESWTDLQGNRQPETGRIRSEGNQLSGIHGSFVRHSRTRISNGRLDSVRPTVRDVPGLVRQIGPN